jgi:hypothetical protein
MTLRICWIYQMVKETFKQIFQVGHIMNGTTNDYDALFLMEKV